MRKFSGKFDNEILEKTIAELEAAHKAEMYFELMYLHKWLRLFMDNTNAIIEGYHNGFDSTGAAMLKTGEIWRQEILHFDKKKARIQQALDLADNYTPFTEAA